jgi:hypothetical protein
MNRIIRDRIGISSAISATHDSDQMRPHHFSANKEASLGVAASLEERFFKPTP